MASNPAPSLANLKKVAADMALQAAVMTAKKGQSINDLTKKYDVATIVHHGEKLILPEGMSARGAITLLERHEEYLGTVVNLDETFDVFPWDGANAINEVLIEKFGWAQGIKIPGSLFSPDKPPTLVRIEVAPGEYKEVPWGRFALAGVEGWLQTATGEMNGRMCFRLVASILRKDEVTVRDIFQRVRAFLATNSIYRGKAIKIRFCDDQGARLSMPEPKFIDTDGVDRDKLVFSHDVEQAIETNLFTPISRVQDCLDNGMAVKRGVLLGGSYGTGKTLAAFVAAKIAVEHGITYIYCPRADELAEAISFARQYQSPACVLFCEDIDRVMAGERDTEMDDILNVIDGIDSKASNLIVVLTTNDLEAIEPAMLRPGRLDAVIYVTEPDARAVERLLRVYGGSSIPAETDLTMAGHALKGRIPAVIAEVIQRAKLAQLRRQERGTKVLELGEDAIIEAANTMKAQLDLLDAQCNKRTPEVPSLDQALRQVVDQALSSQLADVRSTVEAIQGNM